MPEKKEFYTVKDLSELLNILPATIRHHIKTGKIKAENVNGSYIILKADAQSFIEARAQE